MIFKIGLVIFSKNQSGIPALVQIIENFVSSQKLGNVKTTEVATLDKSLIESNLNDLINTNLNLILMVADNDKNFFSEESSLQKVGKKQDKIFLTINADENFKASLSEIFLKAKDLPGIKMRGCSTSCH